MSANLDVLLDELIEVLDAEQERIAVTLDHLNELRAAVIRRQEEPLRALLGTIRSEQEQVVKLDNHREALRRQLANAIGCSAEEMNLSRLCRAVGPGVADHLRDRPGRDFHEGPATAIHLGESCHGAVLRSIGL